jgi:hypothetical protein
MSEAIDSFLETYRSEYGIRIGRLKGFRVSGTREEGGKGNLFDKDMKKFWENKFNRKADLQYKLTAEFNAAKGKK